MLKQQKAKQKGQSEQTRARWEKRKPTVHETPKMIDLFALACIFSRVDLFLQTRLFLIHIGLQTLEELKAVVRVTYELPVWFPP